MVGKIRGIYQYRDLKTGDVVYIGKDSNIGKNSRHKDHLKPSRYDDQPFNRIIQNNPDRYEYCVIREYPDLTDDELIWLECMEIMKHKFLYGERPKFNFTVGADGSCGYRHTDEAKQKMSEFQTGKIISDGTRQKMSESHKGKTGYWNGKKFSKKHCLNVSLANNTSGYYRVSKQKNCKQGFTWIYSYYVDGKRKKLSSVSIKELEKKVKAKELEWRKL